MKEESYSLHDSQAKTERGWGGGEGERGRGSQGGRVGERNIHTLYVYTHICMYNHNHTYVCIYILFKGIFTVTYIL